MDVEKTKQTIDDKAKKTSDLGNLINFIAQALVDNPEEVDVREIEGDSTTVIELRVSKPDLGKVIGKKGQTAHAMRTILAAMSSKNKTRTVLDILE
jgi:predicted RNA-binding protein YlqC (UPF0109 family)